MSFKSNKATFLTVLKHSFIIFLHLKDHQYAAIKFQKLAWWYSLQELFLRLIL